MEEVVLNHNLEEESRKKFRELLLSAIDEGLSVLGEGVKRTIYYYVEKNGSLGREEIPLRPKDFAGVLESIFGSVGATIIEDKILQILHEKIGLKYRRDENLTFSEKVESAMKAYIKTLGVTI